jgi:uncharacterized protein with GYD domain
MASYVVLYKFTPDGAKNIRDSIKRAGSVRQENARLGFQIKEVYWLQGAYDMIAIVDAPSEESMMGAMLNVVSAGNVTSTTMRAFDATEMSRILAKTLPLSAGGARTTTAARPTTNGAGSKTAARKAVAKGGRKATARR